jgi:hypothetical protein
LSAGGAASRHYDVMQIKDIVGALDEFYRVFHAPRHGLFMQGKIAEFLAHDRIGFFDHGVALSLMGFHGDGVG